MRKIQIIVLGMMLLFVGKIYSQDKLFLKNGTVQFCKILALSENTITYRDTIEGAQLITVPKSTVVIAEYKSGAIYIFGNEITKQQTFAVAPNESREERKLRKINEWKVKEEKLGNNIIGFYLPELAVGRFTISYERLFSGKSMGIKIPLSLTFNPAITRTSQSSSSSSSSSSNGSTTNSSTQSAYDSRAGVGFITGVDVNYYYDLQPELKYYFGPRVRYGTDMMLGAIEGLTVQLQNGIFRSRGERFTSTLGFGVGFFKLSEKYVNYSGYDPKQVYPWASFTWRLGFRL